MGFDSAPLKIYTIPYTAGSHLLTIFEISRLLASRGVHVTILATHSTASILQKSLERANASGLPLRVHYLQFPSQQVGLPEGVETVTSPHDPELTSKVYTGTMLLRPQIEQFIDENPPDCIFSDIFHTWTSDFAIRMGIPRFCFDASGCFQICVMEALRRPDCPHRKSDLSESEPFIIPGLPHPITMTLSQLQDNLKSNGTACHSDVFENLRESELKSSGRLVNGFSEFEGEYKEHYEKVTNCKVWHVGPTSLLNKTSEEKLERTGAAVMNHDNEFLSWLNSKQANSVLYICFGSAWHFSDQELYEIASGLESSRCHFMWVVARKDNAGDEDRDKWLPKGFEERVLKGENRGIILTGWVPQTLILEHPAIGGFMTHCGWNSCVDAACAGVPVITWPLAAEQFYNEKLMTQVHKIGVEVGSEKWSIAPWAEKKTMVTRDRIDQAVRKLMNEGEEATGMRRRVRELQQKAKVAMEEGGSTQRNVTALIEHLQKLRSMRTRSSQN